MAPAPDQFSAPGAATYDSNTMTVGDGTWEFTKNTFLLPNLQGPNFDTLRYNGMGNRFSTVPQYHTLITAHGVIMTIVFLFFLPASVMLARFYSREPGYAIRYHAQLNIFAAILLVAAFILPFFAVGKARSLTNPHHGIGIAILVLFMVQLMFGTFVRYITKMRSLRIMLHQWLGRATALLAIVQVPLGLALYGSPEVLFVLYAVWMGVLLVVYFLFSYRADGRRELHMSESRSEIRSQVRSEGGRTRMTESEYFSEHNEDHHSRLRWLGPLAAAAGLLALLRGRGDGDGHGRARSRSRSRSQSRRTTVLSSRAPSGSYVSEKYSAMPEQKQGALMRILAGMGLARLFRRDDRDDRDDVYSAVSTETPHRQRSTRATTISEFDSEYTDYASTNSPSQHPGPSQPSRSGGPRRGFAEESEYSSYVSPSRRPPPQDASGGGGGGFAQGLLSGLGLGWVSRKMADRRAKKEEEQRRNNGYYDDDDDGTEYSRYAGDSRPGRRYAAVETETGMSEMTESSFRSRPYEFGARPRTPTRGETAAMPDPSRSKSTEIEHPHGTVRSEVTDATQRAPQQQRESSRRRRQGERAAVAAAARASSLAAEERDRFGSPKSQPVSVKLRIHDDKDRNLTLRRLTEEEMAAAKERGEENNSALESPTAASRRYRRDSSRRREAEEAAEGATELSPPNPAFAKGGNRRGKDSAYFSGGGQPGPSHLAPAGGTTTGAPSMVSSVRSHGTWSGMSMSPSQPKAAESAAADNRRRRRQERRRTSSSRPSEFD